MINLEISENLSWGMSETLSPKKTGGNEVACHQVAVEGKKKPFKVWIVWQFDQQSFASNKSWQTRPPLLSVPRGLLPPNESILLICRWSWEIGCQTSIWQRFELVVGKDRGTVNTVERWSRPEYKLRPKGVWSILRKWTGMNTTARRAPARRPPQLTEGSKLSSAAALYYISTLSIWVQLAASTLESVGDYCFNLLF